MDLISDRDTESVPGPTTLPTAASPNRPILSAGTANAFGFRNCGPAGFVIPRVACGATPGTTSALAAPAPFKTLVPAGSFDGSARVRNAPLWNTVTPPNCHPPTSASPRRPLLGRNVPPLPN